MQSIGMLPMFLKKKFCLNIVYRVGVPLFYPEDGGSSFLRNVAANVSFTSHKTMILIITGSENSDFICGRNIYVTLAVTYAT
jgi:hypothetical protein